ncbi:hypothetical protein FJT64_011672 [Amphibalanus amphitrite]|uniref:Uncharacterized protein n=1 Tax=Amphibalanus amphitrite TaxID=1232801 RepID=A0A6A4VFR3_AMPAM|nr:hypothetical protein FJT64_011672 [Amphibalanus amphitrite]
MKIQTGAGAECGTAADREQLVPPVGRRRRRALLGDWQTALQAVTIFISLTSLTLSSVVFMVLLYTPASTTPMGQARDMNDLREVVDMQRQMIARLQREDNYQDARQKALQSALAASGLITDDVRARLEGIERALMAKEQTEVPADIAELVDMSKQDEKSSLIGRPDGHERGSDSLIGRPDGHERGHDSLIGRPDGHENFLRESEESSEEDDESFMDMLA